MIGIFTNKESIQILEKRIEDLERKLTESNKRIWLLENKPKFKAGDKVNPIISLCFLSPDKYKVLESRAVFSDIFPNEYEYLIHHKSCNEPVWVREIKLVKANNKKKKK